VEETYSVPSVMRNVLRLDLILAGNFRSFCSRTLPGFQRRNMTPDDRRAIIVCQVAVPHSLPEIFWPHLPAPPRYLV
jgi:hypothetical protein